MLITKEQMWARYRYIKKREFSSFKISCPVCGKEIREKEEGIEYTKTKRGSDVFVHKACIRGW